MGDGELIMIIIFSFFLGKENVTATSPRFYHGLQIPYPIGRNFFAVGKKWERAAVMRFKQELDEHDAKTLE